MTTKLDKRDIQILCILQDEGRITKTALAKKVNLSPTPCWERLQRLEKAGLIEGYNARLSLKKIAPHTIIFMQAELDSHHIQNFNHFEAAIVKIDEVQECWSVGGGIDYLIKFLVKDINHYQQVVEGILHAQIGLKRYFTYVVTRPVLQRANIPSSILASVSEHKIPT